MFARFVLNDSTGTPTDVQFEQSSTPTAYEEYNPNPVGLSAGQVLLLEFEYAWLNIREGTPATTVIETINYTITQNDVDGRHFLIPFTQIEKPEGTASSMIWGRLSRIRKPDEEGDWAYPEIRGGTGLVNDNCNGDFIFLEWDYHYRINRTGTDISYPGAS